MTKNKTSVYDQHNKAFDRVSAFLILKDGKPFARVSFKYPADGAGKLQCFFHVFGLPMSRGTATGYGYDKASAAFANAAKCVIAPDDLESVTEELEAVDNITAELDKFKGWGWEHNVEKAGFVVHQAI